MNFLDWILIVLVGAYALSGYWQGFITGAFATGGLLLGGFIGIWLAPKVLGSAAPSLWVSLGALFVVIACASIGQAVLQYGGVRVRDEITTNRAPSETQSDGAALPSTFGASQMPMKPPSSRPPVANAPVMKPCQ